MTRKSKIIVSVVSIIVVLLTLLGITYAYYLTQIEGNSSDTSISVTTADLRLKYSDGNGLVTKNDLMPGTTIGEKTFTIENTGKTKIDDYAVVLEYAFIEGVTPSIFERPNDFEITLTCNSIKKDGTTGNCIGYTGKFNNENIIMTTNMIESGEKHNYSLTIYYANPNVNQSNDMGKSLNLKVNIYRLSESADIVGEITGVDENHSVKLNSEPKISSITKTEDDKYVYKFKGVPLGTHTLSVLNDEGTIIGFHKIVVQKGDNASTGTKQITYEENGSTVTKDVPSITIKDDKRVAEVTTNVNKTNLTVNTAGSEVLSFVSSFNETSLAYNIINNAQTNKNGTIYSETPKTLPAEEISGLMPSGEAQTRVVDKNYYLDAPFAYCYGDTYQAAKDCDNYVLYFYEVPVGKYFYDDDDYIIRKFVSQTDTTVTLEEEIMVSERILSISQDDYGTSYYFRGNVQDNYVNFAGMCWRIVRIAGDGSTKLILEDKDVECDSASYTGNWNIGTGNYGYVQTTSTSGSTIYKMNYLEPVTNNNQSMVKAFYDFQTNKLSGYTSKLKSGDWCLNDLAYGTSSVNLNTTNPLTTNEINSKYLSKTQFYYDSYVRLAGNSTKTPTLKCNGTKLNKFKNVTNVSNEIEMYVGAITADEVVYAGGTYNIGNQDYYLINNYQKTNLKKFWSLSPYYFGTAYDSVFGVYYIGYLYSRDVNYTDPAFRPLVSLVSGAQITEGDGTKERPYKIKVN